MSKKEYATGDVISIKFLNGDEVIARVIDPIEDSTNLPKTLKVEHPMSVMMNRDGFALISMIITMKAGDEVELSTGSIIAMVETEETVKNGYLEKITGLSLVKF